MINVVYACNDAYVRQTLVSMVSLLKHNPSVKIYLIHDGLSADNQKFIQKILDGYQQEILFLDMEKLLPEMELDEADRHPRTIYAKLFMDELIQEERLLYLDSDVVVMDSLEELFQRGMEHECVAGVLMHYSSKLKRRIQAFPEEPYICDGMVLFNMTLWRKTGKSAKCLDYIHRFRGNPPMLSEGTLNHVCRGEIGILSPRYNLMPAMLEYSLKQLYQLFKADCYYTEERDLQEAVDRPVLIHFMNELYNRPWCTPCSHPYKQEYRKVEKEVFGNNEIMEEQISRHTRMTIRLRNALPFWLFAMMYHAKNKV